LQDTCITNKKRWRTNPQIVRSGLKAYVLVAFKLSTPELLSPMVAVNSESSVHAIRYRHPCQYPVGLLSINPTSPQPKFSSGDHSGISALNRKSSASAQYIPVLHKPLPNCSHHSPLAPTSHPWQLATAVPGSCAQPP